MMASGGLLAGGKLSAKWLGEGVELGVEEDGSYTFLSTYILSVTDRSPLVRGWRTPDEAGLFLQPFDRLMGPPGCHVDWFLPCVGFILALSPRGG